MTLDQLLGGQQIEEPTPEAEARPPSPPLPTTLGEKALEIPRRWRELSHEHFDDMTEGAKDFFKHDSILGHATNALKTVGGATMLPFSLPQAVIESVVGDPIEAAGDALLNAVGVRGDPLHGLARNIGESSIIAGQILADPILALGPVNKVAQALLKSTTGPVEVAHPIASMLGKGAEGVRKLIAEGPIGRTVNPTGIRTEVPYMVQDPGGPGAVPRGRGPKGLQVGQSVGEIPLRWGPGLTHPKTGVPLKGSIDPKTGLGSVVTDRLKLAEQMGRMITRSRGLQALSGVRRREALEEFQRVAGDMTPDERMYFNYHMDGDPLAASLPTGLQPLAKELRRLLDEAERRLVSIGALRKASGNYWPRMFRDPKKAESNLEAWERVQAAATSRRPMRGSRGAAGLLKRTVPTLRESIEKGGLELVDDNPVSMVLTRLEGMDHFYYGTLLQREMKKFPKTLQLKFYKWYEKKLARAEGKVPLDDNAFEAKLLPATADVKLEAEAVHRTAFDKSLRKGVEDVARFLGLTTKRPLVSEDPSLTVDATGEVLGYTRRGWDQVISRFGNNETTMMHEIGHQINMRFGLSGDMIRDDPKAWEELKDLGLARDSRHPNDLLKQDPKTYHYLIDEEERIANLFHAYWHAPHLLRTIAPNALKYLEKWLSDPSRAGLRGVVKNVKPSVQEAADRRIERFEKTFHQYFPGLRELGQWYAPEAVARVFNNYVSGGMPKSDLTNLLRHVGNALNMAQLSLSAFHLSMESMDSTVSAVSLASRAARRGEYGLAAQRLATTVPLVGPLYSGARYAAMGNRLRRALLDESGKTLLALQKKTPELAKVMELFPKAGGRISMDMLYRSNGMGGFLKSFRLQNPVDIYKTGKLTKGDNYFWNEVKRTWNSVEAKNPAYRLGLQVLHEAARTLETTVEPLMVSFVPRVKMGLFHDMTAEFIKSGGAKTDAEFVAGVQKIWDSIDNRLGEMVYDNLFWSKTLKDLSFLAVRAVGWNLGTVRELGGGLTDAVKYGHAMITRTSVPEMTERMRYSVTLPLVVAMQGAVINYLYTSGEWPQELLDYFYPRTGKMTPDGVPERVSLPTYVKDVFAYNYDPLKTVFNKLHPVWETMYELVNNENYRGDIINDPFEETWPPIQWGEYFASQFIPFGFRGLYQQQREGADWFPLLMNEFGFVPAPQYIVNPQRSANYQTLWDLKHHRQKLKHEFREQ